MNYAAFERMQTGALSRLEYEPEQDYMTRVFREICRRAGVPTQDYRNHPDIPGGSTLGCISNGQLSLHAVDIGMAQLAMHASCETAGALDATYLRQAVTAFYGTTLTFGTGDAADCVTLS